MLNRNPIIAIAFVLAASATFTTGCFDDGVEESTSEVSGRSYFEVFEGANGRYYFNLIAGNHEAVLSSQSYSTRTAALGGVLSVLDHAMFEGNYDVKQARDGSYYFNLVATNNQIIGTSEMYASKWNAKRGTGAVKRSVEKYVAFQATRTGARFDVFEGKDGRFYFNLHAANGEIMLTSQGYDTEAAALNGTFSVADNGVEQASYELREARNGQFYFVLFATNGQIIGTSELYANKGNAQRGCDSVVALLPSVELL